LITVIRGNGSVELKKTALYSLGNLDDEAAVPVLLEIAQKDPNITLRKAAVSALSQIDSPKAKDALLKILRGEK
jgi:HEAT repeat protein